MPGVFSGINRGRWIAVNKALQAKLLEKVRGLSPEPGIYRMKGKEDKSLYVGKAKNLRARLITYFQNPEALSKKNRALVKKIQNFDIVITKSEAEALILESILIKKYKPYYNILLKDDKSYPYLTIDFSHSFPKLIYHRRFKKKKDMQVFGPYVSPGSLKKAIFFLNKSFGLRDCSDIEFLNRSRPCMSHQIGICSAPCTSLISKEDYGKSLDKAIAVLKGSVSSVLKELNKEMEEYSKNMEYELAAKARDQMKAIEEILSSSDQKVSWNTENKMEGKNIDAIGYAVKEDVACFSVMYIRVGRVIDTSYFFFSSIKEMEQKELLLSFLSQFYFARDVFSKEIEESKLQKEKSFIEGTEVKKFPSEILLPFSMEQQKLLEESFQSLGVKMKLSTGQRGSKKSILEMANKNAKESLESYRSELKDIYGILSELKTKLKLQNYPSRIECFDISNLGDTGIVASRVTFIEGKAEKSLYRKYKLKGVQSQNDFAAMKEVLTRRLLRSKIQDSKKESEEYPDLIIVDGGKGQLSMAMKVLKELDITGLDVVALAKSKSEGDFQSKDLERSQERVYKPGRMNPIVLGNNSRLSYFMQRVRDEAHRFAIQFQRLQRKP